MYADIIIDISHEQLDKTFQYAVPDDMDGSVDEALRQIEEKGYALPFAKDSRKLYKIGVK